MSAIFEFFASWTVEPVAVALCFISALIHTFCALGACRRESYAEAAFCQRFALLMVLAVIAIRVA